MSSPPVFSLAQSILDKKPINPKWVSLCSDPPNRTAVLSAFFSFSIDFGSPTQSVTSSKWGNKDFSRDWLCDFLGLMWCTQKSFCFSFSLSSCCFCFQFSPVLLSFCLSFCFPGLAKLVVSSGSFLFRYSTCLLCWSSPIVIRLLCPLWRCTCLFSTTELLFGTDCGSHWVTKRILQGCGCKRASVSSSGSTDFLFFARFAFTLSLRFLLTTEQCTWSLAAATAEDMQEWIDSLTATFACHDIFRSLQAVLPPPSSAFGGWLRLFRNGWHFFVTTCSSSSLLLLLVAFFSCTESWPPMFCVIHKSSLRVFFDGKKESLFEKVDLADCLVCVLCHHRLCISSLETALPFGFRLSRTCNRHILQVNWILPFCAHRTLLCASLLVPSMFKRSGSLSCLDPFSTAGVRLNSKWSQSFLLPHFVLRIILSDSLHAFQSNSLLGRTCAAFSCFSSLLAAHTRNSKWFNISVSPWLSCLVFLLSCCFSASYLHSFFRTVRFSPSTTDRQSLWMAFSGASSFIAQQPDFSRVSFQAFQTQFPMWKSTSSELAFFRIQIFSITESTLISFLQHFHVSTFGLCSSLLLMQSLRLRYAHHLQVVFLPFHPAPPPPLLLLLHFHLSLLRLLPARYLLHLLHFCLGQNFRLILLPSQIWFRSKKQTSLTSLHPKHLVPNRLCLLARFALLLLPNFLLTIPFFSTGDNESSSRWRFFRASPQEAVALRQFSSPRTRVLPNAVSSTSWKERQEKQKTRIRIEMQVIEWECSWHGLLSGWHHTILHLRVMEVFLLSIPTIAAPSMSPIKREENVAGLDGSKSFVSLMADRSPFVSCTIANTCWNDAIPSLRTAVARSCSVKLFAIAVSCRILPLYITKVAFPFKSLSNSLMCWSDHIKILCNTNKEENCKNRFDPGN